MKEEFDASFYRGVLDRINSNLYITDPDTDEIVYVNEHLKKTFHLENIEGKKCWEVLQKGMCGHCDFCSLERLRKGEIREHVWKEKNTLTGRTYLNYDCLQEYEGHTYFIQNSIDITEQVKLAREASVDELTGILNRNAGKKRLGELLEKIDDEDAFTVALYDINGLKWVNDTFGHLEGDRLLIFVAQSIERELGEEDFVFRLSGDEFIVVFRGRDVPTAAAWMDGALKKLRKRRLEAGMNYEVMFSYGLARIYGKERLTVSDVLSLADTQMYIQKRDYHIRENAKRLKRHADERQSLPFSYNKDYLFEALADTIEDYAFVGNLKTGEFMYSRKMVMDFELPGQVITEASAFWAERIHPDDVQLFLRSNQEIASGRVENHAIAYRAKDARGNWVRLLCRGKMIRDEAGRPDLFTGVIRRLDADRGKAYE